ncbi:hypothetical protein ACFDTO_17420 [Microbacteriaceae bacterium 4G12]
MSISPSPEPAAVDRTRDHIPDSASYWVLGGAVSALLMLVATVHLFREQLHSGCTLAAPGIEGAGTWTCGDGLSLLQPVVESGAMTIVLTVIGVLVAARLRNDRVARVALTALAVGAVTWMLLWTWDAASRVYETLPAGVHPQHHWFSAVGPAAVVAVAALAVAVVSALLPGRVARVLLLVAIALLGVATVLQVGLAASTLLAMGLLAGARTRTGVAGSGGAERATVRTAGAAS